MGQKVKEDTIVDKPLTKEEFNHLVLCGKDVFEFAAQVKVIHPIKGKVPFLLYPYQKSVLWNFLRNRFNIILKFRQAGITELIAMYCLWLAMFHDNKNIQIISIKDRVAKRVLRRIRYMYRNLPDHLKVPIINGRGADLGTATEIEFCNGSQIVSIPTTEDAGRSEAASLLVIDEAAIVRWASQIWAAAFPTLSTGGSAIINSCVTGDTKILTRKGAVRVDTLAPTKFGRVDLRHKGLEVLSHTGNWRKVLGAVNKGSLETWEVVNGKNQILKCTPDHKLLTTKGWMPVKGIVEKGKKALFYDFDVKSPKKVKPPEKEVRKIVDGFPNYQVSNLGKVYYNKNGVWLEKKAKVNTWGYVTVSLHNRKTKKKISRNRLVATHFIGAIPKGHFVDHINCVRIEDHVNNLQIISPQQNSQRGADFSVNHKIGAARSKGQFSNIPLVNYVQRKYKKYKGKIPRFHDRIIKGAFRKFGTRISKVDVTRWGTKKRCKNIYSSRLKVVRKFRAPIYDICVEKDESYFTDSHYVNHNTPYGVGNFFHKLWVAACSGGGNGFVPLRLKWAMHPERDLAWYNEQLQALGPRRTAQEIDGDFLTSGYSVFNLLDIKALEESINDLTEDDLVEMQYEGGLLIFENPRPGIKYFLGADVSTGRAKDYSAFSIMTKDGREVACFKGKLDVRTYTKLLNKLGRKYNNALLAPEGNDIGLSVVTGLQDLNYPNLYYARKLVKKKGKKKPEVELIPGWYTTKKTRPIIIDTLEEDIANDLVDIKDPHFVREAYTFIYDSQNRPIAMGKKSSGRRDEDETLEDDDGAFSDDSILAKCITNYIRKGKYKGGTVLPQ